jgi:hypothetical protein
MYEAIFEAMAFARHHGSYSPHDCRDGHPGVRSAARRGVLIHGRNIKKLAPVVLYINCESKLSHDKNSHCECLGRGRRRPTQIQVHRWIDHTPRQYFPHER